MYDVGDAPAPPPAMTRGVLQLVYTAVAPPPPHPERVQSSPTPPTAMNTGTPAVRNVRIVTTAPSPPENVGNLYGPGAALPPPPPAATISYFPPMAGVNVASVPL